MFNHSNDQEHVFEGDEDQLRTQLARNYPHLEALPNEQLVDLIEDLHQHQHLDVHLEPDGPGEGIDVLQDHDDPLERRLALKAAGLQPIHLRNALQDEDPMVREAAALNTRLTPELMQEALASDDEHLHELLLRRPDLTDNELAIAWHHPELRVAVLRHPACSQALKEELLSDPTLPEGLRTKNFEPIPQLHKGDIEMWVQDLQKGMQGPKHDLVDHLGGHHQLQRMLEAAEALGLPVDAAKLAQGLGHGLERIEAVLTACGLPNSDENRMAVMSILAIQADEPGPGANVLKSDSQSVPTPKKAQNETRVQPLMQGAEAMAKDVQDAFKRGEVEPVKLGGKHSVGTMMAKDEDGRLILLKPGSGANSGPQAGATEDPSSQSRREAAFYRVARLFGIAAVSEAQLLSIDGKEIAALRMLPLNYGGLARRAEGDPGLPRKALAPLLKTGLLHRWAVLDWVCGSPDRHGGNLLVGPPPEHNLALIDHGSAFCGDSFDPANDPHSFTPFYLRAWAPETFAMDDRETRLRSMPTLAPDEDAKLRDWVLGLNPEALGNLVAQCGINPEPEVMRLVTLQGNVRGARNASETINGLWV